MCYGAAGTLTFYLLSGHVPTWKWSFVEGRSRSVVRVAVMFHPTRAGSDRAWCGLHM